MLNHSSDPVVIERFWAKVDKSGTCWLWTAGADKNGYGKFTLAHHCGIRAHRFSWTIYFGLIPVGLFVLHRCDTPACVRPDHLFLGTNADNQKDRKAKGRSDYGEHQGAHKLSEAAVLAIRTDHAAGTTLAALAQKHGVCHQNIHRIVTGQTWRHLLTAGSDLSSAS